MPGYISEYKYYGVADDEFIEVAVPAGTDVSSYSITLYDAGGFVVETYSLGTLQGTFGGQDVYVVDNSTAGFNAMTGEGEIFADDGIALVDDSGTVLQFLSHWGYTVTAVEGPANGMTSTEVGTVATTDQSLQTDDGGSTYYVQDTPNKGSIPACYAPGTRIATLHGCKPIEHLRVGDLIPTSNRGVQPVCWIWSGVEALDGKSRHQKPVLISRGALGHERPDRDLVVSGQHRIAAGVPGQLDHLFAEPVFVPAKALTCLLGIRYMAGKQAVQWHHFVCAEHAIVRANNVQSETLLLGAEIAQKLAASERRALSKVIGRHVSRTGATRTALPTLTKSEARSALFAACAHLRKRAS